MRFRNKSRALKLNGRSYDIKIQKKKSAEFAIKLVKAAMLSASTVSQIAFIKSSLTIEKTRRDFEAMKVAIENAMEIQKVFAQ